MSRAAYLARQKRERQAKRPKPARGKAYGILNPYGDLWTYEHFQTVEAAEKHVRDYWAGFPTLPHDLAAFKVVPVRVTVSVLPPSPDKDTKHGK